MKLSEYKSYDELPLFLNAAMVAKVLGVSPSSGYELMHGETRCNHLHAPSQRRHQQFNDPPFEIR